MVTQQTHVRMSSLPDALFWWRSRSRSFTGAAGLKICKGRMAGSVPLELTGPALSWQGRHGQNISSLQWHRAPGRELDARGHRIRCGRVGRARRSYVYSDLVLLATQIPSRSGDANDHPRAASAHRPRGPTAGSTPNPRRARALFLSAQTARATR